MGTTAVRPARRPLDRVRDPAPAARSELLARALGALRASHPERAWLWADKLCRISAGPGLGDAYLLRSAALALMGDHAAAEADLRAAINIDPDAPAPNRALLASPRADERLTAARCLLRAADAADRAAGFTALAHEHVDCVGLLGLEERHLVGQLVWNGRDVVDVTVRTDIDDRCIQLRFDAGTRPAYFEYAGQIDVALPPDARVVTVEAPGLRALFEPGSLLLSAPGYPHRCEGFGHANDEPLIIVPVYDDRAATLACLKSLFASQPNAVARNIVVVDDASPDLALSAALDELAAAKRLRLLRNTLNMGFAGSVNRALSLREAGQDVLLLNADTIVPPGAIEGLARHVRNSADIGTATPLSNNGEDTSFPRRFRSNPMLDYSTIVDIHKIAARVNAGRAIAMPNGVGFCLYVRGDVCDRFGPLSHSYGRGYYEDVEFCLKAAEAGYRNVCATDVYVGHHGSRSFATGKRALVARNLRRLDTAYPSYLRKARAFEVADPLRESIGRLEEALLCDLPALDLVMLPFDTPGILAKAIVAGLKPSDGHLVVVRAQGSEQGLDVELTGAEGTIPQNIVWRFASDAEDELMRRLSALHIQSVAMLDAEALPRSIVEIAARLEVETRVVVARPAMAGRKSPSNQSEDRRVRRPALAMTPAVREAMIARNGDEDVAAFALPDLPEFRPPRLVKTGSILAIVGMKGTAEDRALLQALAETIRSAELRPTIVVAGALPARGIADLPASIHVSGPVGDEELPDWLTRLGAHGLLFADRDWGIADPRTCVWAGAGLRIAHFGDKPSGGCGKDHCLILPRDGAPAASANSIAVWLAARL